jgi:uncharacterized protein (DUF1499 family)
VRDDLVKVMLTIFAIVAVVAAVTGGVIFLVGPERIWRFLGPSDLGPIEFETLARRTTPNDALACPPDLCQAKSDVAPPLFTVDVDTLRAAMAKVIASEPRVTLIDSNDATLTARYIQRSALLKFPDTIVVRYIERPEGGTTLAIYSRSQLGHSDLGVNLARLKRWLMKLQVYVREPQSPPHQGARI